MTTWFYAVCDVHRVRCPVVVTFNDRLSKSCTDEDAQKRTADFLNEHGGCELRLIHRDDQLDNVEGYQDLAFQEQA